MGLGFRVQRRTHKGHWRFRISGRHSHRIIHTQSYIHTHINTHRTHHTQPVSSSSLADERVRGKRGRVARGVEVEEDAYPWSAHVDKTNGMTYYWNKVTDHSQWNTPPGCVCVCVCVCLCVFVCVCVCLCVCCVSQCERASARARA
jgi:hypothetical protein